MARRVIESVCRVNVSTRMEALVVGSLLFILLYGLNERCCISIQHGV